MSAPATALTVHRLGPGAMAQRAVTLITERIASGAATGDLAVLARVNSALLPVQVALTDAGVAHTAPLDHNVLGRTGVRTALAYLRIGADLSAIRREDLFDTINRPARKVKSAVQPLLSRRGTFSIDHLEQVLDSLETTHRERFAGYLGDLQALGTAIGQGADTAACLAVVRDRIGLGEAMDALDASRRRPEGSSHGDDLDALEQLAALHDDPVTFRGWLNERLRAPGNPDGVTLSSVHRVKGMEWPHVIVFAANQGLFPHRLADDLEEERRVFHVAITRCQQQVDVITDTERASPFVAELTRPASRERTPAAVATVPTAAVAPTVREDGAVIAKPGLAVALPGRLTGTVTAVTTTHAVVALTGVPPRGTGGSGDHAGAAGNDAGNHDGTHDRDGAGFDTARPGGADDPVVVRVPFGESVIVDGNRAPLVRAPLRTPTLPPHLRDPGTRPAGPRPVQAEDDGPVDEALLDALRGWRARVAAQTGAPAYLVFHDRHLRTIAARKPQSLRDLATCPGVGPIKLERYGDDVLDLVAAHGS